MKQQNNLCITHVGPLVEMTPRFCVTDFHFSKVFIGIPEDGLGNFVVTSISVTYINLDIFVVTSILKFCCYINYAFLLLHQL